MGICQDVAQSAPEGVGLVGGEPAFPVAGRQLAALEVRNPIGGDPAVSRVENISFGEHLRGVRAWPNRLWREEAEEPAGLGVVGLAFDHASEALVGEGV